LHIPLLIFLTLGIVFPTSAESSALIVYPEVREPYSGIFLEMIAGFRSFFEGDVKQIIVNGGDGTDVVNQFQSAGPDIIVALGSMTLDAVINANTGLPLLVGAITGPPPVTVAGGISMSPSADVYLDELLRVYPGVRRVFFVFSPERDLILRQETLVYLQSKGINAVSLPASDIRESAIAYKELLKGAVEGDAVWLYPNSALINSSLLSSILDVAWSKRLAVFSSNPLHVKRGALFALYPDNQGIGRRLALMANAIAKDSGHVEQLEPLRDIRIAVNGRTSDHLGLTFSDEMKRKIDLFLPGR